MDIVERVGTPLLVGLRGPDLEPDEAHRIAELSPGGVILFRRNLDRPERLAALVRDLEAVLAPPWLLAIDQEGGRVARLEPWSGPTPAAARLAEAGADVAFRFGNATGRALLALGFDLDFAPVVDLCPPEAPNGIGDRSFGIDPRTTAHLAGSFLDGLQSAGVAGCLKHFPGLGDTAVDSHLELPVVTRDRATLERFDLAPYRSLGPRAAAVMVGHGNYPGLGCPPGVPASLSSEVVAGVLRGTLGYDGVVVSDDLEMGAVAPLDRDGRAATAAVAAGCDLLPYCSDLDRARAARDALARAAEESDRFRARLDDAARAVRRLAARWPRGRTDPAGWEAACRDLRDIAGTVGRTRPPA